MGFPALQHADLRSVLTDDDGKSRYNSGSGRTKTLGVGVSEVTRILKLAGAGDTGAEDQLLRLVHDELHRIAASQLSSETPGHTLQTTALVNEAYIRLMGRKPFAKLPESSGEATGGDKGEANQSIRWDSRAHFFAAAAEAMRRILIDSARRKKRNKRGGEHQARAHR